MEVHGKMSESDVKENTENIGKACEPCQRDNNTSTANGFCKECDEYMCDTCFRQHIKGKVCRHHVLVGSNLSSLTLNQDELKLSCKRHDGEIIKFYCRTHEVVGCGDCIVAGHKSCKTEYIKDLSNDFKRNVRYKTFKEKIDKLISEVKNLDNGIQNMKMINIEMMEKALEDVQQFRLDINEYLDKVQANIVSNVKDIMRENETLRTKLEADSKAISTKLEKVIAMLNIEQFKDNALFIHTVACKPTVSENEMAVSDMKLKKLKQYKFLCDQRLRSLITSEHKLGTLVISSSSVLLHSDDKGVRPKAVVGARVKLKNSLHVALAGTVTDVHKDGEITVKWDDGESGRHREGVGDYDVTLA